MQQHAVPQNVTSFEFKIVGFLTLKQFGMLAVCAIFAFLSFLYIQNFIAKVSFTLFFAGLGALLAFGSVQNIPFYRWIFIFIQAIFSPTQRIWIKTAVAPAYMTTTMAVVAVQAKRVIEDRTVLSSYLQTLPNQKKTSLDVLESQKLQGLSLNQAGPASSTIVQPQAPLSHTPLMTRSSPPPQQPGTNEKAPAPVVIPIKNEQTVGQDATIVHMQQQSSPFDNKPAISPQPPIQMPKAQPPMTNTPIMQVTPPATSAPKQPTPIVPASIPTVSAPNLATNAPSPVAPKITPPPQIPAMPKPAPAPTQVQPIPNQQPPKVSPVAPPKQPEQAAQPAKPSTPIPPSQPTAATNPPTIKAPEAPKNPVNTVTPPVSAPTAPETPKVTPPVPTPTQQASPKLWSTIQVIEREFLEELKQMRESDEKEKAELKARLAEIEKKQAGLEQQKQDELKKKESELSAQKDAEIKLLQEQFDKQRHEIEAKQTEKTKEEEKYLKEMQQKLDEEKAKRELFEQTNTEINNRLQTLLQEKAVLEVNLKDTASKPQLDQQENEKMKQQVGQLNAEIEKLRTESLAKVEEEKARKSQEGGKLQEEMVAQKKALEEQKLQLETEKKALENERNSIKKQNDELTEQKKRLQELESQLEKRQQDMEAANKKSTEQHQIKSDSLDQLADQLQKETDKLAANKKPEGIVKSETLIVPKPEKASTLKASYPKDKTADTITDLETANIPQITNLVNVINGVVYDANGNLVPNVIIIVKDIEKTPVRALKSNRLGQFAISTPLPNGTYTMEFEDSKEERTFNMYQVTLSGSVVPPIAIKERT